MILDFNSIKEAERMNFQGGKGVFHVHMYQDEHVKIMKGMLEPGAFIGFHAHVKNSEIIFITEGHGKVRYDDTEEAVTAGSCHYCPKGHAHSLINSGNQNLHFYAVVPEHE